MSASAREIKATRPGNILPAHPAAASRIEPPRIFVYVDAVARYGSIRKAAEALHVVSSALNRRILDLEQELGCDLFERLPRGVRPTAAGELLLDYVRRSMRELEDVGSQIDGLRGLLKGRVRIAVAESVTGRMLPMAIARFQAQHDGVCFHVWVDGPRRLAEAITGDETDLILTHDLVDHPDIDVVVARPQPLVAVVSSQHPLASRTSVCLRDCVAFPVVLPDPTLAVRGLIDRALAQEAFRFEPALVSNSVEFTKIFARANNAVSFQFRVGSEPDLTGMIEIPVTDPGLAEARLYLATRRGRKLSVAASAFLRHITDCLADL